MTDATADTAVLPIAAPLETPDRRVGRRIVVFLVGFGLALAFGKFLLGQGFGRLSVVAEYSDLQMAALTRMETVCEKTFALSCGLIGALGAAMLGLSKGPTLRGPRAWAIALAVGFAIVSAMSGLIARYKMIEVIANRMPGEKLLHAAVQTPLGAQMVFLFLAVAALGWYAIDDALRP